MDQREEYWITLQFFSPMINRNAILFTQFLCSISMHWIFPCINICTTTMPSDDVIYSRATGITIETAFIGGVTQENSLSAQTKKSASVLASNYQLCCWHCFAHRHGSLFCREETVRLCSLACGYAASLLCGPQAALWSPCCCHQPRIPTLHGLTPGHSTLLQGLCQAMPGSGADFHVARSTNRGSTGRLLSLFDNLAFRRTASSKLGVPKHSLSRNLPLLSFLSQCL